MQPVDYRTYLSGLQVHGVQVALMVLNLDGPRVVVVVVLVRYVHDRGHHVRGCLAGNKRTATLMKKDSSVNGCDNDCCYPN
jgi:hypothetical protein